VIKKIVEGKVLEKMIYPITERGDWCERWHPRSDENPA
jgi:hypothetical protein